MSQILCRSSQWGEPRCFGRERERCFGRTRREPRSVLTAVRWSSRVLRGAAVLFEQTSGETPARSRLTLVTFLFYSFWCSALRGPPHRCGHMGACHIDCSKTSIETSRSFRRSRPLTDLNPSVTSFIKVRLRIALRNLSQQHTTHTHARAKR